MENLPHYQTDHQPNQMYRDAVANIENHNRQHGFKTWDQAQVEKELNLYHKQLSALEKPVAENLSLDEKKTLRTYYNHQIKQRRARLDVFLNGMAQTARAIKLEVSEPQILAQ